MQEIVIPPAYKKSPGKLPGHISFLMKTIYSGTTQVIGWRLYEITFRPF